MKGFWLQIVFGYVKPLTPELKVKEHAFYQSVYCGLCRANGKKTGCLSRLALRYDLVFLALIRMALCDTEVTVKNRRCMAHPLRRRPMTEPCDALDYAALAGALLAVRNLDDKINDSRGVRKFAYRTLHPMTGKMRRRARALGDLPATVDRCLSELHALEAAHEPSPDRAAEAFGELLGNVFAHGLTSGKERIAYEIGRHTGRWIYLTDAVDDAPDDRRTHSYNPLSALPPTERERIRQALYLELSELQKAADLISFADEGIRNIVNNIIHLGMPSVTDRVLDHSFPVSGEKEQAPQANAGANGS